MIDAIHDAYCSRNEVTDQCEIVASAALGGRTSCVTSTPTLPRNTTQSGEKLSGDAAMRIRLCSLLKRGVTLRRRAKPTVITTQRRRSWLHPRRHETVRPAQAAHAAISLQLTASHGHGRLTSTTCPKWPDTRRSPERGAATDRRIAGTRRRRAARAMPSRRTGTACPDAQSIGRD